MEDPRSLRIPNQQDIELLEQEIAMEIIRTAMIEMMILEALNSMESQIIGPIQYRSDGSREILFEESLIVIVG